MQLGILRGVSPSPLVVCSSLLRGQSFFQSLIPRPPLRPFQSFHAFDLIRGIWAPVDLGLLILVCPDPSRGVAFQSLDIPASFVRVFEVDTRHDGNLVPALVPQIFAEKLGFTLKALSCIVTPE